jgi:hypothetical protein
VHPINQKRNKLGTFRVRVETLWPFQGLSTIIYYQWQGQINDVTAGISLPEPSRCLRLGAEIYCRSIWGRHDSQTALCRIMPHRSAPQVWTSNGIKLGEFRRGKNLTTSRRTAPQVWTPLKL